MGLQIILCVEANNKSKSDYIYIKSAIEHFYKLDRANNKLTAIYMDGKGNYNASKTIKLIRDYTKQYEASGKNNRTVVFYCFDCDQYDVKSEDKKFLQKAKKYCKDNGYEFVWFCRDIEHVFLEKQIPKNKKTETANNFAAKGLIDNVNLHSLQASSYQSQRSNLGIILGKYLDGK